MSNVLDVVVRHLYVPDLKARWGIHAKLGDIDTAVQELIGIDN
jgi:hypothetical protein